MNRQKERVVRMENQKKYIAFRRAYPVFYYHGFSLSQEGDALCVRYDFEIENGFDRGMIAINQCFFSFSCG